MNILKIKPAITRDCLKPFDIVTPNEYWLKHNPNSNEYKNMCGIVTETDGEQAYVDWFGKSYLYVAWWSYKELKIIDNAMRIITNSLAHPFGDNTKQGDTLIG